MITVGLREVSRNSIQPRNKKAKKVVINLDGGKVAEVAVLSFRDYHHKDMIVNTLAADNPVAFHGWGVSGVCGRVDKKSKFQKFWELKSGRRSGSKIPLLEPPGFILKHIDWVKVHPDFRYLQDSKKFIKLWRSPLPFHLICPVKRRWLSEAVVTPAFDSSVAPNTPVPTACFFWIGDPALDRLLQEIKKINQGIQLGVSSLNDSKETPPFNTEELVKYLQEKKIDKYKVLVEDPLVELIDIASSHSQFAMPLAGEKPVWVMKRKGSFSAAGFQQHTGFPTIEADNVKTAARKHPPEANLDKRLYAAAKKIRLWQLKS